MITIPPATLQEMHKLAAEGTVCMLLSLPDLSIYIARNNEDVTWEGAESDAGAHPPAREGYAENVWQKFYFELGVINLDSQGKLPELAVQIDNVGRIPEYWVDTYNCFCDPTTQQGYDAYFYVVNTETLDETTPVFSLKFQVMKVTSTEEYVTIKLGLENPFMQLFPYWRTHPYKCQYQVFKGELCGYSNGQTTCNRQWETCKSYGNQARFGGQPGTLGAIMNDILDPISADNPAATTLVSPQGIILSQLPTYKWSKVTGVTSYWLQVNYGPSFNTCLGLQEYTTGELTSDGDNWTIQPAWNYTAGLYKWWVQTEKDDLKGVWSRPMIFNLQYTTPDQIVLYAPSGFLSAGSEGIKFYWVPDADATSYEWWLSKETSPSSGVYAMFYDVTYLSSEVTTYGEYVYIQCPYFLPSANYRWWVRGITTDSFGSHYGTWSTYMDFALGSLSNCSKVTLTSPIGLISTIGNVTFQWETDTAAEWYEIIIAQGFIEYAIELEDTWYVDSDLIDLSPYRAVVPATQFSWANNYIWKVRSWNANGYGDWSDYSEFTICNRAVVTLNSPSGTVAPGTQAFQWTEDVATHYELYLCEGTHSSYTIVSDLWYPITGDDPRVHVAGGVCTLTPSYVTESGKSYVWWIRSWSASPSVGYSAWSNYMEFICS